MSHEYDPDLITSKSWENKLDKLRRQGDSIAFIEFSETPEPRILRLSSKKNTNNKFLLQVHFEPTKLGVHF